MQLLWEKENIILDVCAKNKHMLLFMERYPEAWLLFCSYYDPWWGRTPFPRNKIDVKERAAREKARANAA